MEMYATHEDEVRFQILAIGVFHLYFGSWVLILEDYLYVPSIRRNLIFVTYLGKSSYTLILKDNAVI